MHPLSLEVISPIPEGWRICLPCEIMMARAGMETTADGRGLEEYPAEWMDDFRRLSSLILDLAEHYGENILIRIWDPRSLPGLFKSLRYGVRRYPTFIIDKRQKIAGLETAAIEEALQARWHVRLPDKGENT